tara:strand:+ start:529 stop:921 length:393 start_codon:yes stop_codon:yes gene_type:complete
MSIKVVGFQSIGVTYEEEYNEMEDWIIIYHQNFKLSNGAFITMKITENNYGDEMNGDEFKYYYLKESLLNQKSNKSSSWKEDLVSGEEIDVLEDFWPSFFDQYCDELQLKDQGMREELIEEDLDDMLKEN